MADRRSKPRDLHVERAARIFNVPYDQVTEKQRKYAKTVAYVHNYSVSQQLAQHLEKMKQEAMP